MKLRSFIRILTSFSILSLFITVSAFAQLTSDQFPGMKARNIGPGGMSGRVTALDAVNTNPDIFYVGAATGGLWKTENGGITFKPIFDKMPTSSIGAIAINQNNTDIVWVGTGEANPRNSVGVGYGVYKSLDAGNTWTHMGLPKTERINRIILDPNDKNVAYVAALGTAWGENPERGIFKTTDGGITWTKVLFVDNKTGGSELVMDPSNPDKLFATMWDFRRDPWYFTSGGEGSGLYVTQDGGKNWVQRTSKDGLPEGILGRIGVAIAKSNPNTVYAVVEAKKSVLSKSLDGGVTWKTVNKSENVHGRPFYYTNLRTDPIDENRLYNVQSTILYSIDGGKSLETLIAYERIHVDFHAMWISPIDGQRIILGNDGGVAVSPDRGKSWEHLGNLPLAQFYHINVDNENPFNVYGGLQDNGSWRGPSNTLENGGIRNHYWHEVAFGDGFATLADPDDAQMGYAMSQGGYLERFNNITGDGTSIRPDGPDGVRLRFNWNAAIAQDPFDNSTIYYGSQFVHKSTDKGNTWTILSPDLTTNDPEKQKYDTGGLTFDVSGAENHTTIMTIAPSTLDKNVIWVGTDDGNLQVTKDGGKTWENVVKNVSDVPKATWIPHIEPSKYDAAAAYVVFDDHRRSNWTPYAFKTTNYGKNWTSLTKNSPVNVSDKEPWGYFHVIEEDPINKNLLFLGTEFGMYISFDAGINWMKWTNGLPTVPVRGLIVHPRDHDLVIGTHGRAAYILDDIRPLRTISKSIMDKKLTMFEIPDTYMWEIKQVRGTRFIGDKWFFGENKKYGAMISYVFNPNEDKETTVDESDSKDLKDSKDEKVVVEVSDQTGKTIRRFKGTNKKGVNRIMWEFDTDGFRNPGSPKKEKEFEDGFMSVIPGTYTVTLKSGEESVSKSVEVKADPRVDYTMEDYRLTETTVNDLAKKTQIVTEAIDRIDEVKEVIKTVNKKADKESQKGLIDAGKSLDKKLEKVANLFIGREKIQGFNDSEDYVSSKISGAMYMVMSSWSRPSAAHRTYIRQAVTAFDKALVDFNALFETDVAAYKADVEAANLDSFPSMSKLDTNWKKK